MIKTYLYALAFTLTSHLLVAQLGPGSNWYFGQNAGITFTTNPPTAISGSLVTQEGCSAISDNLGNMLFYTDGTTVYSKTHTVMANGTGLAGNNSTAQSGVIVQQPNNPNIYYIFTMGVSGVGDLNYSIVNMTLAAGFGSVTVKNSYVYGACLEKLTAVKHSNNTDIWVVVHENGTSTNFRAFLLTATGLNTTGVISNVGTSANLQGLGYLKFSPSGNKLASALFGTAICELYDFNRTTGVISNAITLSTPGTNNYGVEFSPDGSKLYCSSPTSNRISQWSICAGSASAIAASHHTIVATSNWALQLAPDGKIYVARYLENFLGVIHNPNAAGAACNYIDQSFSITGVCRLGLPNYVTSWFLPPVQQFTTTIGTVTNGIGCMSASFTAPPTTSIQLPGCSAVTTSLSGIMWNFGDPGSGSSNTTTALNPLHQFSNLGTFSVSLILYYSNNISDTLKQVLNITLPCISVSSTSITCANLGSATVTAIGGVGPFTYTWHPTGQMSPVANGLSPGTYTITVHDIGNNYTYSATALFTSLIPLTGNLSNTSSLSCFGAATGTANYSNIAGGSGSQFYSWINGSTTLTVPSPTNLSAGLWNATVTDALTGCTINDLFIITQPFAQNPVIVASTPTTCAGTAISFTASNSGGTPGTGPGPAYTFTWVGGAQSTTHSALQTQSGAYVYTVMSSDANNCVVSQTILTDYIQNPTLTVANVSICPLETGTLSVSGASTYTWSNNTFTTSLTDNPLINTQYTVLGSALSCTSSATASIILKPVPIPIFSSNSPQCQNKNLLFSSTGGTAFVWTGVNGFVSVAQNNTLSVAHPTQSGVYQVTVTAANSCTATTQGAVTIHPTPTISAAGATVCVTQALNLSSSSFPGSNFVWTGPNNFVSLSQNPVIANPVVNASGNYTVLATSLQGCTITATAHSTVTALPVVSFISNSPQCFGKTLSFNASASTGAVSYSWTGPNGFSSTLVSPTIPNVTVPASGNYMLTLSTGPCVVSASQSATVHPLPIPVAFNTAPVCEGKPFQMGVNSAGVTYTWTGSNGYYSNQQTINFASAQLNHSASYTVQVTDANTCQNFHTTTVSILQNPVVNAAGDLVCFGQPAQLSAVGADTYYWRGPGSYTASGASPQVNPTINAQVWTYTVTGMAVNGCTAVATTTVATRVLPIPSLSVTPRACVNSKVYLNGNGLSSGGALQYYWTGPLNYASNLQNTWFVAPNTGYAGTYSLMVMDGFGCKGYTSTPVMIDPEPTGQVAGKLSGCVPFCSSYSLQSADGGAVMNSIWTFNNQSISSATVNYCFNKVGTFELKGSFEDALSCRGTLTQAIEVYPVPIADFEFSPAKPVENQDVVVFNNASEGAAQTGWSWYFNDGKNTANTGESTTYFFEDAGKYAVAFLVENTWGCLDTIVKSVEVVLDFNVYIPNAFTPNGDGLNDVFMPVFRGVKRYDLKVFDRWGSMIFATSDPNVNWDGTVKGDKSPIGTYNYKLVLLNTNGEEKEYSGVLSLLR